MLARILMLSAFAMAPVYALAQVEDVLPMNFRNELGEGPWHYVTRSPEVAVDVAVVARGIEQPFGMVFVPGEGILVVEQAGSLRVIRDGRLRADSVSGLPAVSRVGGLMDIILHPDFASNRWLYFTYMKDAPILPEGRELWSTITLARGRLSTDLMHLEEVEDLLVADAWGSAPGGTGSRLLFDDDGYLFMSSPFRRDFDNPQNPASHISKVLRLDDQGRAAPGNPFAADPAWLPEIWTLGHRAIEGMAFHPVTGELWASEHGPQGGDELNIIRPGQNYGWPLVSYGRDYDGSRQGVAVLAGMTTPELFWVPSIATSGMMFYTGDAFPDWQGDLFVGSLMTGRVPGTGHVERIEFNASGEQKREVLLRELGQRIRDIKQGPDGLIYVLTDEDDGTLLRLSPSPAS